MTIKDLTWRRIATAALLFGFFSEMGEFLLARIWAWSKIGLIFIGNMA